MNWYIELTDEEQGQVTAFGVLLEVDAHEHENLASFLDACRMNICDLLGKASMSDELQDFIIWLTGCGYNFTQHPYFCQRRDELLLKEYPRTIIPEDIIERYYDAIRATEECTSLMSSAGWVDGKAAKIMQDMYDAQSDLFAVIGIDYHGGHKDREDNEH